MPKSLPNTAGKGGATAGLTPTHSLGDLQLGPQHNTKTWQQDLFVCTTGCLISFFFLLPGSLLSWRAVNVIVASFLTQGQWTRTPQRRLRRSQDPDQRPSPLIEYRSVRCVLLRSYKRRVAEDFLSASFEGTDLDGPPELPQAGMTSTSGEGGARNLGQTSVLPSSPLLNWWCHFGSVPLVSNPPADTSDLERHQLMSTNGPFPQLNRQMTSGR